MPDLTERSLVGLVRAIVRNTLTEAQAGVRIPRVLSGAVEDLDSDLDVVYVRMDQEANSGDPYQSDNWGMPGVIPATRVGETFVGEQVRVSFDGKAGATANRTSIPSRIVLPYGTESGERIELDGETGTISIYNDDDLLVGYLDAAQWFLGIPGQALARLDPLGGLRLRDQNDMLRAQLSAPEGLILRDAATGISGLTAGADGLVVLDPATGDRISITSGTTSAVPTPHWAGSEALSPGSSHTAPAIASFDTGDDFDLRFICASAAADLGAQSYTPPGTHTERVDQNTSGSGITLASTAATRDPADASPALATFTNTSSAWTRRNGHTVIIRGGGTSSPVYRSVAGSSILATDQLISTSLSTGTGTANGDLVVAFVAMASAQIPVGWTVPEGWKQLGVQVSGLGTSHVLASGIWYKRFNTGDPTSYPVTINMSAPGITRLQSVVVSVQNPYGYPSGLDIRRNNRSMPRGNVAQVESTTDTTQWTHANLPQSLETMTGLSVFAGRKYDISYSAPIVQFVPQGDCIVEFLIEIDPSGNGTGWTTFHKTQFRRSGAAATYRDPINLHRAYTPPTDLVLGVRFWVINALTGAGYFITLFGSSDYRRILSVDDIGAVF